MDIEDETDLGLGLYTPGKNFVDIEDTESDNSEAADVDVDILQDPENKTPEKVNLSDVVDNLCKMFSANPVPSTWPFLVGNLVCFRPSKTSQWLDGKVEVKIPGVDGNEI